MGRSPLPTCACWGQLARRSRPLPPARGPSSPEHREGAEPDSEGEGPAAAPVPAETECETGRGWFRALRAGVPLGGLRPVEGPVTGPAAAVPRGPRRSAGRPRLCAPRGSSRPAAVLPPAARGLGEAPDYQRAAGARGREGRREAGGEEAGGETSSSSSAAAVSSCAAGAAGTAGHRPARLAVGCAPARGSPRRPCYPRVPAGVDRSAVPAVGLLLGQRPPAASRNGQRCRWPPARRSPERSRTPGSMALPTSGTEASLRATRKTAASGTFVRPPRRAGAADGWLLPPPPSCLPSPPLRRPPPPPLPPPPLVGPPLPPPPPPRLPPFSRHFPRPAPVSAPVPASRDSP